MQRIKAELEPHLGEISAIEKYARGNINDTYKVTATAGIFSVRICKKLTIPEIKKNISLLNELSDLAIPRLLAHSGEYIFDIDGRPAIVYQYIEGETLREFDHEQLNAVGLFLAEFHTKGLSSTWCGHDEGFYFLPSEKISNIISHARKAELPRLDMLLNLSAQIENFQLSTTLPEGPIHVDIKPDNILFLGGELSGVIDFDNAYRGPFILDLAKSMVWFGLEPSGGFSLEKASEILRGYIKGRRVTFKEYCELYKAIHYAFISHIVMDYYMYALKKTNRSYFDYITGDFLNSYNTFAGIDMEKSTRVFDSVFEDYQFRS